MKANVAGGDLNLMWSAGVGTCTYDVYRSPTPYFSLPGSNFLTTVPAPPYLDALGSNYFYRVRWLCGTGRIDYSGEVGQFNFVLTPGE